MNCQRRRSSSATKRVIHCGNYPFRLVFRRLDNVAEKEMSHPCPAEAEVAKAPAFLSMRCACNHMQRQQVLLIPGLSHARVRQLLPFLQQLRALVHGGSAAEALQATNPSLDRILIQIAAYDVATSDDEHALLSQLTDSVAHLEAHS